MVLLLSMSPRLTMDMDTTPPSTPMDTILDMDMARDPLMPSLDMLWPCRKLHTQKPPGSAWILWRIWLWRIWIWQEVCMDTMEDMAMEDMDMAR